VSSDVSGEAVNRPHYSRFKLQGENRFIARVHSNKEYKVGSIYIPNIDTAQDIETTGEVLFVSPIFDHEKFPDIQPGAQVKVIINSWHTFDCLGDKLAIGDAEYVIACYDPF
jgi:hypothetical protein